MPMATKAPRKQNKRPGPSKGQGGRPPKAPGEVATHAISTRWTDVDKALLDALVSAERARLREVGLLPASADRVTAADVLRSLVREEARRRGLLGSDAPADPSP